MGRGEFLTLFFTVFFTAHLEFKSTLNNSLAHTVCHFILYDFWWCYMGTLGIKSFSFSRPTQWWFR